MTSTTTCLRAPHFRAARARSRWRLRGGPRPRVSFARDPARPSRPRRRAAPCRHRAPPLARGAGQRLEALARAGRAGEPGRQSSARASVRASAIGRYAPRPRRAARAGLDALGIPRGEGPRGVRQLRARRLDDPGVGRERPVDRGGLVDLGSEPGQLVADRRVAFVEAFGRAARGALEELGVAQASALQLELRLLAGPGIELVDLAELPPEKVLPLGSSALVGGRGPRAHARWRRARRPVRRRARGRREGARTRRGSRRESTGRSGTRSRAARRCRTGRTRSRRAASRYIDVRSRRRGSRVSWRDWTTRRTTSSPAPPGSRLLPVGPRRASRKAPRRALRPRPPRPPSGRAPAARALRARETARRRASTSRRRSRR